MLSTLLVIDTSVCAGFECPLTIGIFVYVVVAILACCCCYPGACLCAQRFRNPKSHSKPNFLAKFDFFGSIGEVLENEVKPKDVAPLAPVATNGNSLMRRNTSTINY